MEASLRIIGDLQPGVKQGADPGRNRMDKVTSPFEGRMGQIFRWSSAQEIHGWEFSLSDLPAGLSPVGEAIHRSKSCGLMGAKRGADFFARPGFVEKSTCIMHIYIYTYIYIHTRTCVYIYIYTCIW